MTYRKHDYCAKCDPQPVAIVGIEQVGLRRCTRCARSFRLAVHVLDYCASATRGHVNTREELVPVE